MMLMKDDEAMERMRFEALARRLGAVRLDRAAALRGLAGLGLGVLGAGPARANNTKKPKKKPVCVCPTADPAGCRTAQIAPKQARNRAKTKCNYTGRCQRGVVAARCRCGRGGPCRVFGTSTDHDGNLGGLSGADAICQGLAKTAGLPGTYKAWLSDGTSSPSTRFVRSPGPYVLVDGTVVANDWTDLTTCDATAPFACLAHAIDRDEIGTEWVGYARTGTLTTGEADSEPKCLNWSSADENAYGGAGSPWETDRAWTTGFLLSCRGPVGLCCFQQG